MPNGQLLVEIVLKATVILAAAGLLNVGLRRASAATRHLVWCLALGAVLVLPLLTYFLPSWQVPILPQPSAVEMSALPASAPIVADDYGVNESVSLAITVPVPVAAQERPVVAPPSESVPTPQVSPRWNWSQVLLAFWCVGSFIVLARLVAGTWHLRRITKDAECLTDYHWSALVSRLTAQLHLGTHISLYSSVDISVPVTWGIWRPVVLLPADAAMWTNDWRRIVLLHELGHIKRRDCLLQMVANCACILFWFHPLVWVASRRMRVEREFACDDYVLGTGTRASDYAGYLVEIAKAYDAVESATPIGVGMACSHLEHRVRSILNPSLQRGILSPLKLVLSCLLVVSVIVPLASLQASAQEPITPVLPLPPVPAVPAPLLDGAIPAEVIEQAEELVAQQKKLALYEAKAQQGKLTSSEKEELARVQVNISEIQAELRDKLALRLDTIAIPAPVAAPLPVEAPAPVAPVEAMQPLPSPAPLQVRVGKFQADLSSELAAALIAIQDAKKKEKEDDKNKEDDQALTADTIIRLKIAGVTPEYIEAIKKAGLDNLSPRQISELKLHNVSPEFIKEAQSWSSEKLSARDFVNLKIAGVTPDYLNALKSAGFVNLPIRKVSHMRMMGVTPEYAAQMKRVGLDNLTADQLTQLRIHGITEDFVRQVQGWGLGNLSVREILEIKIHGVKPEDAQTLKTLGFDNISLRDLTQVRIFGVNESYVKELRGLGLTNLNLRQVIQLKQHGVDSEYIRKMRAAGFKNISANDVIKMKIQGIDAILLKN